MEAGRYFLTCLQHFPVSMENKNANHIASFLAYVKKHIVPSILCFNMLIFLETDTLLVRKDNEVVDRWYIGEKTEHTSAGAVRTTTHAVVTEDHTRFLYFREVYMPDTDSLYSQLVLYRADGQQIWQRVAPHGRTFARFLSEFIDDMVVVVITNQYGAAPSMERISSTAVDTIVREGDWYRLSAYEFSPNRRFIVMHVKNPYREKVWDYIHFIDLQTGNTWSYLFPICVTCKRYKHIDVSVDNDGISEVVYKGEHRVFNKEGVLIDVFIKF